ncbi:hypothetical protein [Pontibacter sp. H249]|uniref:hypothetical protein n=1 Tax=Pontibacter sp. H249 TaxID=3133420 RepID=UPI0030BB1356
MERIYIIESPSDEDLFDEKTEGKALYEALKLSGCDCSYKLATSKDSFLKAFSFIIDDFYKKSVKLSSMPFIHISAHGDEDGIQLTSGELFDWVDFNDELKKINEAIGYIPNLNGYSDKISRIVLCLSTCRGYNAFKIHEEEEDICEFQCIIGPPEDITWSDSLTAFIVFYHAANYQSVAFNKSVERMNFAIGSENAFKYFVNPEIGKKKSIVK